MASASPTLFLAVHLYAPSMYFTVSGNRSSDSFSVSFTVAPEGRLPFSKPQLTVGFGTPLALQLMLVVLPSRTVWSLGKTSTWGEAKRDETNISINVDMLINLSATHFNIPARYLYFKMSGCKARQGECHS